MGRRIAINLSGKGNESSAGGNVPTLRKIDVGRKFRRIILLVICLYALSWLQTTFIVDRFVTAWLK